MFFFILGATETQVFLLQLLLTAKVENSLFTNIYILLYMSKIRIAMHLVYQIFNESVFSYNIFMYKDIKNTNFKLQRY